MDSPIAAKGDYIEEAKPIIQKPKRDRRLLYAALVLSIIVIAMVLYLLSTVACGTQNYEYLSTNKVHLFYCKTIIPPCKLEIQSDDFVSNVILNNTCWTTQQALNMQTAFNANFPIN